MATYAQKTFNAARYAAARPTYPKQLYDFIFAHHGRDSRARWDTVLDLGCGTGKATLELTPFRTIIGADPSAGMLSQLRSTLDAREDINTPGRFRLVESSAEKLEWLGDASVDMIISAQAAHWLDWSKVWPAVARVLKPGGSLAAWGYSQFRLPRYPTLTPLIHAYCQGTDPRHSVGPYWEQPGRNILDDHLRAVPDPRTLLLASSPSSTAEANSIGQWASFERVYFTLPHHSLAGARPSILRTHTTWAGLLDYLRTFSALHTMKERVPEASNVEVEFWEQLRSAASKVEASEMAAEGRAVEEKAMVGEEEELVVEWPLALLLARRG